MACLRLAAHQYSFHFRIRLLRKEGTPCRLGTFQPLNRLQKSLGQPWLGSSLVLTLSSAGAFALSVLSFSFCEDLQRTLLASLEGLHSQLLLYQNKLQVRQGVSKMRFDIKSRESDLRFMKCLQFSGPILTWLCTVVTMTVCDDSTISHFGAKYVKLLSIYLQTRPH